MLPIHNFTVTDVHNLLCKRDNISMAVYRASLTLAIMYDIPF